MFNPFIDIGRESAGRGGRRDGFKVTVFCHFGALTLLRITRRQFLVQVGPDAVDCIGFIPTAQVACE